MLNAAQPLADFLEQGRRPAKKVAELLWPVFLGQAAEGVVIDLDRPVHRAAGVGQVLAQIGLGLGHIDLVVHGHRPDALHLADFLADRIGFWQQVGEGPFVIDKALPTEHALFKLGPVHVHGQAQRLHIGVALVGQDLGRKPGGAVVTLALQPAG